MILITVESAILVTNNGEAMAPCHISQYLDKRMINKTQDVETNHN